MSSSFAQKITHLAPPIAPSASAQHGQFAELISSLADPADAVCARATPGSVVTDPAVVTSTNGVLEVSFQFQTTVDANGLTRYCYLYTDSAGVTQEAPTLEVNPGDQLILHFYNDLPATTSSAQKAMPGMKMKAADTSDSDCSASSVTSSSTNIHFHGTNVAPVCHQDEVIHTLIGPQTSFDYTVQIPSNEPTGLYWYHPHPHGYSDLQVLGGASGVILVQGIENVNPAVANLPERVFVLRDQDLPNSEATDPSIPATDLSINYVPITYPAYTPAIIQTGASEKEFWRVVNASSDTLLDIQVLDNGVAQPLQIVAVDGVPLTDSNGNATTVTQTDYVMVSASRVEFVVTTPAVGDTTAQLVTQTWNNGATGDYDPGRTIASIVSSTTTAPGTTTNARKVVTAARRLPGQTHVQKVKRFAALDANATVTQRTLYFSVASDFSAFYLTVDGQTPAPFSMDQSPNLTVTEGTEEQWTIENRSTMDHSFHIHQLHFQTLAVNGVSVNDTTLRDTIDVTHWSGNTSDPYPSVTLLMDFRDPNIVGTFVYHCHILSHEDLGMMGEIQVLPGASTTTLTANPVTSAKGSSVTLTATVAPGAGSGTPTGTVTFLNGTTTLGTGTLSAGVATLVTTALPIGTNSLTAAYGGDTSFTASTSTAVTETVTAAATTTALTSSPATISLGGSATLTAKVAATVAANGTPTGTVTFLNGGTTLGTGTLNGAGVATYTSAALPVGSASITAVYAGNASFATSTSAPLVVVVGLDATTTTLTAAPTAVVSGASVALTAKVAPAAVSGTPTGTVTFKSGTATLGTATLASGVASYRTTSLAVGTDSITAVYRGDESFAASTSAADTVTVSAPPADFAVVLTPASLSVAAGATGTSTLSITPANGFASAVSFSCSGLPADATCAFSPATIAPSGTAVVKTTMTVTTAATTSRLAAPLFPGSGRPLYALVLPGLGALIGLGKLRKRLPWAAGVIGMLLLSLAIVCGVGACGGGKINTGSPGTPAGTSSVTVTATSGTTVHTATLSLTVTQ